MIARLRKTLKDHPFVTLQKVLSRVPGRPMELAIFTVLQLDGVPRISSLGTGLTIRYAGREDLEQLANCADRREIFQQRFDDGDYCLVAESGDEIAGFVRFCTDRVYTEDRFLYSLLVPPNAVYCFDGYTKPSYRRRGILKALMGKVGRWMQDNGKTTPVAIVDLGNYISWNTHVQGGFVPLRRVKYLRLFRRRWFFSSAV